MRQATTGRLCSHLRQWKSRKSQRPMPRLVLFKHSRKASSSLRLASSAADAAVVEDGVAGESKEGRARGCCRRWTPAQDSWTTNGYVRSDASASWTPSCSRPCRWPCVRKTTTLHARPLPTSVQPPARRCLVRKARPPDVVKLGGDVRAPDADSWCPTTWERTRRCSRRCEAVVLRHSYARQPRRATKVGGDQTPRNCRCDPGGAWVLASGGRC